MTYRAICEKLDRVLTQPLKPILYFLAAVILSTFFSNDLGASIQRSSNIILLTALWVSIATQAPNAPVSRSWIRPAIRLVAICFAVTVFLPLIVKASVFKNLSLSSSENQLGIPALIIFLLAEAPSHITRRWIDRALAGALILAIVGVGGFFGASLLVIALFVLALQTGSRREPWLWTGGAIVALAAELFLSDSPAPGGVTAGLWNAAWNGIVLHPWFGYGPGGFLLANLQYPVSDPLGIVRFAYTAPYVGNEYLQSICEWGIPAGGLFLMGILWLLAQPARTEHPWERAIKASLITWAIGAVWDPLRASSLLTISAVVMSGIFCQRRFKIDSSNHFTRSTMFWKAAVSAALVMSAFVLTETAVRELCASQGGWEWIVRVNPWDGDAWHSWGQSSSSSDDRLYRFSQAVRRSPDQVYFRESYALALESTGNPSDVPKSLQAYLEALRLSPFRAPDALAIGRLLYRTHDAEDALHWFEKARAIEPAYWLCDLWISRCDAALGRPNDALAVLLDLRARREALLKENPIKKINSPYTQLITAYDDTVVNAELRALSH